MVTVLDRETQRSQSTGGRYCEGCPRCTDDPVADVQTASPTVPEPASSLPPLRPLRASRQTQRRHIGPDVKDCTKIRSPIIGNEMIAKQGPAGHPAGPVPCNPWPVGFLPSYLMFPGGYTCSIKSLFQSPSTVRIALASYTNASIKLWDR